MLVAYDIDEAEVRLTLCMIVKDEAAIIGRCLDSVKGVVDEIIIVDTGSTDDTVSICKQYGAQVFPLEWRDHFAEARNYGLKQASGDWLLWMDADEVLDSLTSYSMREILQVRDCDMGTIELINYVGSEPPNKDLAYMIRQHRLFRNHKGFQFHGAIHEQLNAREVLGDGFSVYHLPVKVHHYGYMDFHVQNRNKSERNTKLLELESQVEGYSPWVDYHLASEQYRIGRYPDAYQTVNHAIRKFIELGKLPPSLCYKLKYDALLANGSAEGGWPSIERAIKLYPDYVDLHFYKGIILFHKEKYKQALETFNYCLTLGEHNLQYLSLRGVGSFHAWYYIGLCFEKLEDVDAAIYAYRQCITEYEHHEQAQQSLARILEVQASASLIKISLCMIVRDEELSLERCLDSVKGLVDEIIIVDTGSIDNTKQIARDNNAKVFDFEWIDDFAAARNYAFSKATKEYILWLDADDVIQSKDYALFKQLKETLPPDVQSVTMAYVLTTTETGAPLFLMRRNRLVRRDANFKWYGPVHEYLAVGGQIHHSDVAIYHRKDKQYSDRNLRIYENRLAREESFTARDLYYYANELKDHGRYEDALTYYEKFLQTNQGWAEDCIQACLKMETCHAKLNQESERLPTLFRSFEYDKPHSDVCCQIGDIMEEQKRVTAAMYWYTQATQLPMPADQLSMTQSSTWTWIPHLKLCVCYDRMGQTEQACLHNEIALQYYPNHPSMQFNRDYFKQKLGDRYEQSAQFGRGGNH